MKRIPRLLEREDVNIKVNQASIRFVMAKQGVIESDFIEHHGWIHEGLKIPSKGLDKDGRYYGDDRIFYGWGVTKSMKRQRTPTQRSIFR